LFVGVCEFFDVVEKGGINGVDIFVGNGDFREKCISTGLVVRIGVIKWNDTFVGVEDLPVMELVV
jgi:hypothetical protein